jgi:hypothetical protein
MRLFQNFGLYKSYRKRLEVLSAPLRTFRERINVFLDDQFGAVHILKPVLEKRDESFFTNGDDLRCQKAWARENGLPANATLADILLAQIESHNTEVFYNLDPITFSNSFIRRLPGCVKRTIAWRAAPSTHQDFNEYDLVVNNFPCILKSLQNRGCKTALFYPAHVPAMDSYARNVSRDIDVLFVGSFSRNHTRRARLLETVASLVSDYSITYCLDRSRVTKLAETPLGILGPLAKHRLPKIVRTVSDSPKFGKDLYSIVSRSKIVLNAAIDMAGNERGNMRCWEAMGCGAALLSDSGVYPEGMSGGQTFIEYTTSEQAKECIQKSLAGSDWERIAKNGYEMISQRYSKDIQWRNFEELAG